MPETEQVRKSTWAVAPIPADLQDRRVEITGPTDRKMVINALNSGAKVFMADFEDANTPTWTNLMEGHLNLRDAVRRTIAFKSPEEKDYRLKDQVAVLFVRPRGWHLPEKHLLVDGEPVSGSLFDFALYMFHNAKELLTRQSGPYFYLPKLESHLEARLWNEVFDFTQDALGNARGSIRATVLIETILAAFEMEEILYELRDHSAEREATDGHDGTWVAHPGLVPMALSAFEAVMKSPNQIDRKREDVQITAADLLKFGPEEPITDQGLRTNVTVGVQYLESWLRGLGCVPIFNLMEDAATAEISRAQIWQWIRHPRGVLSDGRKVTKELFRSVLEDELAKIKSWVGPERYKKGRYSEAAELFDRLITEERFVEFLTLPATNGSTNNPGLRQRFPYESTRSLPSAAH